MNEIKTIDDLISALYDRWKHSGSERIPLSQKDVWEKALEMAKELKQNMAQSESRAKADRNLLHELSLPFLSLHSMTHHTNMKPHDSLQQEEWITGMHIEQVQRALKIRKHLEENP